MIESRCGILCSECRFAERKVASVAKTETEYAQFELAEAERLKKELLGVVDGDSYLEEQVIELRYQNHMLKEENKALYETVRD